MVLLRVIGGSRTRGVLRAWVWVFWGVVWVVAVGGDGCIDSCFCFVWAKCIFVVAFGVWKVLEIQSLRTN